jgi:hypothetical protein
MVSSDLFNLSYPDPAPDPTLKLCQVKKRFAGKDPDPTCLSPKQFRIRLDTEPKYGLQKQYVQ